MSSGHGRVATLLDERFLQVYCCILLCICVLLLYSGVYRYLCVRVATLLDERVVQVYCYIMLCICYICVLLYSGVYWYLCVRVATLLDERVVQALMLRHTAKYVSAYCLIYCYICVLILPHTAIYVSAWQRCSSAFCSFQPRRCETARFRRMTTTRSCDIARNRFRIRITKTR